MPVYFTPQLLKRWSGRQSPDPAYLANLQSLKDWGAYRQRQAADAAAKKEKEAERDFSLVQAAQSFDRQRILEGDRAADQFQLENLRLAGQERRDALDARRRREEASLAAGLQADRDRFLAQQEAERRLLEQAHQQAMQQGQLDFREAEAEREHQRALERMGIEQGNILDRMASEYQQRADLGFAEAEHRSGKEAGAMLDNEIAGIQQSMMKNRQNLTPEGRKMWGDLAGELVAIRSADLRPAQKQEALGQWLERFHRTRMEDMIEPPPSFEQEWQQNTFKDPETGHRYQRILRNGAAEYRPIETPKAAAKPASKGRDSSQDDFKLIMDSAHKLLSQVKEVRNLDTGEWSKQPVYGSLDEAVQAAAKAHQSLQSAIRPPDPPQPMTQPGSQVPPGFGDASLPGFGADAPPMPDVPGAMQAVYDAVKQYGLEVPTPLREFYVAKDLLRRAGVDVDAILAKAMADREAEAQVQRMQPVPQVSVDPGSGQVTQRHAEQDGERAFGPDAGPAAPFWPGSMMMTHEGTEAGAARKAAWVQEKTLRPDVIIPAGTPEQRVIDILKHLAPGQSARLPDGRLVWTKEEEE